MSFKKISKKKNLISETCFFFFASILCILFKTKIQTPPHMASLQHASLPILYSKHDTDQLYQSIYQDFPTHCLLTFSYL